MVKKIDFFKVAPKGMQNLLSMEKYFSEETSLDIKLKELVKIRASQINGCAYCLNMHTRDALKHGETNQRIFLLDAWEETSIFSEKEKVALELTEKMTLVSEYRLDEEFHARIAKSFTEKEFVDLILLIGQINTWNRINISINNDID